MLRVALFLILALALPSIALSASVPISYDEPTVNVGGGATPLAYTTVYYRYGNCDGRDFQGKHSTRATAGTGAGTINTTVRVPLRADLLPVIVCFCVSATDTDEDESACNTTATSGDNPKIFTAP